MHKNYYYCAQIMWTDSIQKLYYCYVHKLSLLCIKTTKTIIVLQNSCKLNLYISFIIGMHKSYHYCVQKLWLSKSKIHVIFFQKWLVKTNPNICIAGSSSILPILEPQQPIPNQNQYRRRRRNIQFMKYSLLEQVRRLILDPLQLFHSLKGPQNQS